VAEKTKNSQLIVRPHHVHAQQARQIAQMLKRMLM